MTINYKGVFVKVKQFHKTIKIFIYLIVSLSMLSPHHIFAEGDSEAGKLNLKFVPRVMGKMVIAPILNGPVLLVSMNNT